MLGELITRLEAEDPNKVVKLGFANSHSYRGYYQDLAFEPAENVTVGSMLAVAREALGSTYQGYKGGAYTMNEYSDVWLAERGDTGEQIGPVFLDLLLQQTVPSSEEK